jgi:hypothetical protein
MDKELIDYIINHYSYLLSFKENVAQKHLLATEKAENSKSQAVKDKILTDLATKDEEILQLLDKGYEEFKSVAANKIVRENPDKVFVNRCSKC